MMKNKLALYIMTFKGLKTLQSIIDNKFEFLISYVVVGEDKNTLNDYSSEISQLCIDNGLTHYSRKNDISNFPEYVLTVSWRWMIRDCPSRIIVLHESLLPKYRGFAPLVNQLINKEEYVGVSAIYGEKEYDTGDLISQKRMKVNYPIKINKIIEDIIPLYEQIVCDICEQLSSFGSIQHTVKQDEEEASFSLWRDEDDYRIDWDESSENICRFVNAVGFPYKGASAFIGDRKIRIFDVTPVKDLHIENRHSGKILCFVDKKSIVVCGSGLLQINEASYDDSRESIFPLSKFRIRFH